MAPIMGLLSGFAKRFAVSGRKCAHRPFATIGAGFSLGVEIHVFHQS